MDFLQLQYFCSSSGGSRRRSRRLLVVFKLGLFNLCMNIYIYVHIYVYCMFSEWSRPLRTELDLGLSVAVLIQFDSIRFVSFRFVSFQSN